MAKLQGYINYEQQDAAATRAFIEQCPADDPDVLITQACLLFQV